MWCSYYLVARAPVRIDRQVSHCCGKTRGDASVVRHRVCCE